MDGESKSLNRRIIQRWIQAEKKTEWQQERRKRGEAEEDLDGGWQGVKSLFPVFLDSEAPLPGEMVVFVIVGELGLDVIGATGKHPFGWLLHGGEELVFLIRSGPVAADHVLWLVN